MKLFRPNVILNVELENIDDEDMNVEKFMELVGYYSINEVILTKCSIQLRSSANYLLAPAKVLRGINSQLKFTRFDQVLTCHYMKFENCKFFLKLHCDRIFHNVRRCYMSNCNIKDSFLTFFGEKLEELIIKKTMV